MFSPVISGIVKQEMEKEAQDLEEKIGDMETTLERTSELNDGSDSKSMADCYSRWDNYQDIDELETNIAAARNQLTKLKERIARLSNDNAKNCSHRYACHCSGDKQAEREVVSMTTSKRLREMLSFKEQGNTFFGEKKYREALAFYEKSLIFYEYCFDGTDDERKQADALRLSCLLNAAACFLHLNMYPRCIEYCDDALQIDDNSTKALFRRARAYRLQGKLDEAEADLVNLQRIDSEKDVRHVEREMELLKSCRRQYDAASKHFARRAMSYQMR